MAMHENVSTHTRLELLGFKPVKIVSLLIYCSFLLPLLSIFQYLPHLSILWIEGVVLEVYVYE